MTHWDAVWPPGTMARRRLAAAAILLGTAACLTWLLVRVLAPGGWTPLAVAILLCFLGVAPWLGLCAANGVLGVALLLGRRDPARAVLPVAADVDRVAVTAPTALAVTIRHESMARVLPPLRRLLEGLDAAGAGHLVALFILSDSDRPAHVAAEAADVAAFRAADRDPARIRYRRRPANTGYKAGNVMDFCDTLADGFDLAVMLDADSVMTPDAVLLLVRIMQAAPRLGIVQHLTIGLPARTWFTRLFQFGMRAGMRTWAVGQAWWQGDEGPYWGHNAILRIAPFRAHARLPLLPGGRHILSHDQVEAAQLRAAGWGVCVWADESGSFEANPPTMPDFVARDLRWLAGNMQYRHLLRLPGLRAMGRWQLLQAMLLFAGAPLYVAMFVLACLHVATGGGAAAPSGRLLALALAWPLVLYGPKLLGYAETLLSRTKRAGVGTRFAAQAAREILFTLLLDAPMTLSKTLGLIRLAAGRPAAWHASNREARRVTWAEAARLFWPHTLFGLATFGLLAAGSWGAVLWALPFAGGLLVAIPLCVVTSGAAHDLPPDD